MGGHGRLCERGLICGYEFQEVWQLNGYRRLIKSPVEALPQDTRKEESPLSSTGQRLIRRAEGKVTRLGLLPLL
jgi:hypothetical protein